MLPLNRRGQEIYRFRIRQKFANYPVFYSLKASAVGQFIAVRFDSPLNDCVGQAVAVHSLKI